jgi:hypothetical protein
VSEKDSICTMSIYINGYSRINLDTFYYDKDDCRMIPTLLYANNNALFLYRGSGSSYREIYRYINLNNKISKCETQFDFSWSDSLYCYYPFICDDTLSVLKEDSLHNFSIYKTDKVINKNKLKTMSLQGNELNLKFFDKESKVKL